MRCRACGALNPAGAAWCGQCLTRFDVPDPGATPADAAAPGSAPDPDRPDPTPAPASPGPVEPTRDAQVRDVRTVAGEVEWRCRTCDGWNPLLAPACATCGTAREGFGTSPTAPAPATTSLRVVLLASAVWPGGGHLLAGRRGSGIARALLWGLWAGGAWSLGSATGAARAPGLVLVAGALVLWVATLRDTAVLAGVTASTTGLTPRRAAAASEWLGGRALGVLVTVVTAALLLALVTTTGG